MNAPLCRSILATLTFVILRAGESFGEWLHTYLTLRNEAKRSVSKGGDAKDVMQAAAGNARAQCVLPPFETLAEGACECADSLLRVR